MPSDRMTQVFAGGAMLAALAGSVFFSTQVASSAGRYKLVYADRLEAGDPPEVGLGIAMGAFRGLFVNMLWLRANEAKEKGNYYEAIDLSRTITRLQPRFPRVWAFHAWNMAYNISVQTQTVEERWNWVNAGIRLLRNEAIPKNDNDILLHRELAWTLIHKVQGVMDDANQYYKRRFAEEWTIVLGPPRPADPTEQPGRLKTREENVKDSAELVRRVAMAFDSIEQVKAAAPGAEALIAKIAQAGIDLSTTEGRLALLRNVEVGRAMSRLGQAVKGIGLSPDANPVLSLLNDPGNSPSFQVLVPHIRKRVLVDEYHMEPDRMVRYIERYGPMDWRHPASHALYWAARGVDQALTRVEERTREDFDFLNTDRMVAHAAQEMYRYGTVVFDILNPNFYLAIPNADWLPVYRNILNELIAREAQQLALKGAEVNARAYNLYAAGYENFMRDAVVFLYRRGQKEQAAEYQRTLLEDMIKRRLNWNNPSLEAELSMPLEQFVLEQVKGRIGTPYIAQSEVVASLQGAYVSGLLAGNPELFKAQFDYAKAFHAAYFKEQVRNTLVDPEHTRMEVMDADFSTYAGKILVGMVGAIGLTEGSIMYNRAPQDLRLQAYDLLAENLKPTIDGGAQNGQGPKFDVWFPAPEGIEQFRAIRQAQRDASQNATRAKVEQK